jgi:hypothetical protein
MKYAKVENHPDLVRDLKSGAIINTNVDQYHAARRRKTRVRKEKQEIQNLKNEMKEIKELLHMLINKDNNNE